MIVLRHKELAEAVKEEAVTVAVKAVVATEIAKEAVEVAVNAVEAAVEIAVETVVVAVNAVEEMAKAVVVVAVDAPEPLSMRRARLLKKEAVVVVLAVTDLRERHAKMLTLWIDKTELDVAVAEIANKVAVVATGEAIRRLTQMVVKTKIRRKPKIPPLPSKRKSSKLPSSRKAKRKRATLLMISLPRSLPNQLVF